MPALFVFNVATAVVGIVLLALMLRRDRAVLGVYSLALLVVSGIGGSVCALVDAT